MAAFLAAYSALTFAYISAQFYADNRLTIKQDFNCLRSMPSFTAVQSEGQTGVSFAFLRVRIYLGKW